MRILMIHVSEFSCTVTEKGRSPIVEEPETKTISMGDGLVVLVAVEKADEENPDEVAGKTGLLIAKHCAQLGTKSVVICSFAHLFAELGSPQVAVHALRALAAVLEEHGLGVQKTPFGWFNTFEMKAKGHPLSRVARTITLGQ